MTRGGLARRLTAAPVLLLLAACAADGSQATPSGSSGVEAVSPPEGVRRVLHLDAEGRASSPGSVVPTLRNAVAREMTVSVATTGGGRAVLAEGPDGEGRSLRLPAFEAEGPVAAAVVVVRAAGEFDALAPARRDFRFGARFRLDKTSGGTEADNGDNLVQRGLFADDAQYKLQIDGGVPSCLVRGAAGEVLAKAGAEVDRERWYDATCTRTQRGVELRVEAVDGAGQPIVAEAAGATGRLVPGRRVPLAIGGKVSPGGQVTESAADPFNGLVDDVFFEFPR